MWGNSYPIIPNNSLSQDISSALILAKSTAANPPTGRLIFCLSSITHSPPSHLFICFTLGRSVLLNIEEVYCNSFLRCICMFWACLHVWECEWTSVCVCLWQVRTNSRPEMLWTIMWSRQTHYWISLMYSHKALKLSPLEICNLCFIASPECV